jgi:hypothetical protein
MPTTSTPALARYGKAAASVAGFVLVAIYSRYTDGRITDQEWVAVAIAGTQGVSIWLLPLAPGMRWGKSAVGVILAVLQALTTLILGGLDTSEIMLLVITGLTAAGIVVAPATSDNGISSTDPTTREPGVF